MNRNPESLIRPIVRKLHPYTPGEQPKMPGLIKLNTNENPFPPSPHVLEAVRAAVDARLRLYPNPTADRLREKLAAYHGCKPENIIVGNGSDELLEMAVHAFVEPVSALRPAPGKQLKLASGKNRKSKALVQYFEPSYSLYPVLAQMHGAVGNAVPLNPDFTMPSVAELRRRRRWDFDAALTFVTTPNAPTGTGISTSSLEELCTATRGVVVLDEAYADFAPENALHLALKYPNVLVSRTFSKAYSLCFLRVGYFVGHPTLIAALHKIRDSYNVNGLGQIAAEATLEDLDYYRANIRTIIKTRDELSRELTNLGFSVIPSVTNFIFTRPPRMAAVKWYEALRQRNILVRWFDQPVVRDYLRITIGTAEQMEQFLSGVRQILARG